MKRSTLKLTDAVVARLPAPPRGHRLTPDAELPGFNAQITAASHRAFVLRYRINGKQRQVTIGGFPTWTTSAARQRAKELRRLVDQGIDPLAAETTDTVATVIAEFIKRDQQPRNRTWAEVERILRRELAPWLDRPIQSITRRDVIDRLDAIVDRGAAVRANRTLAWTGRLFRWALERDIIEASPAAQIRRPTCEVARDRVLPPDELAAVLLASTALQSPGQQIVPLLVVTAARLGEVVHMRREHLDLDRRLWTVPADMNKAGRIHEIPLSDLAMEIIGEPGEGLVFPARSSNRLKPVSSFGRTKARLDQLSGVTDWRLHDLRRTAASGMARLGHPPHVVAAILNHAPASTMGITAVYNRHRYADEKRAALDGWSREVARIIGRGEAKVVTLPRTA
jgi:integrase